MSGRRRGTVVAFDEHAGLGEVRGEGGTAPFHCVAIADGSRAIEVGAAVSYRLVPGLHGRWEAADLVADTAVQSPAADQPSRS